MGVEDKLNPLHKLLIQANPNVFFNLEDLTRRTGRSTARALLLIGNAIESPHQRIPIADHHDNVIAHRLLMNTMKDIVGKLDLKCLTFIEDYNRFYIVFTN